MHVKNKEPLQAHDPHDCHQNVIEHSQNISHTQSTHIQCIHYTGTVHESGYWKPLSCVKDWVPH